MKVIIAGSREIKHNSVVKFALDLTDLGHFNITEVVCGGADGVDQLGAEWALHHQIPVMIMRADWDTHGRAAGPIRNQQMAEYADQLVAIWDGKSKGTANMILEMHRLNKPVWVHTTEWR